MKRTVVNPFAADGPGTVGVNAGQGATGNQTMNTGGGVQPQLPDTGGGAAGGALNTDRGLQPVQPNIQLSVDAI